MHDVACVRSLVSEALRRAECAGAKRVVSVSMSRSSAFPVELLLGAFAMLSRGTALEGARLTVETVDLVADCPCGHSQVGTRADMNNRKFICPCCGRGFEAEDAEGVQLVNMIVEEPALSPYRS